MAFVRPEGVNKFAGPRTLLSLSPENKFEIGRMVGGILSRVARSGRSETTVNPTGTARGETDLNMMFGKKWEEQKGLCSLCDRPLMP